MKKKIITILLAAVLSLSLSAAALAAQAEETQEQTGELSFTTIDGTQWSISCPPEFSYDENESYQGGMGQKNEKKHGVISGDFKIGICDGELYTNVYEDVAALNAQFKKADIYEERTVGGVNAYISQNKDASMKVVLAYQEPYYICLNFFSETGEYQKLYESEAFQKILDSIAFGGVEEKAALTSDQGYLTVTPVGAWFQGESKYNQAITLYNDSIGPVTFAVFDDSQLSTVEKLKEYTLTGYSSYSFEEKTIGNNTFEVLDAGSVSYLVAPTSSGKGLRIELRNCTLEQAEELLETVEIK